MALVWLASAISAFGAGASGSAGCEAQGEYDPVLVANPERMVTIECLQATALEVIQSAARQARMPMGLVLGRDGQALSRDRRPYDLRNVSVKEAMAQALQGTGYTMRKEDGVLVLEAGDVTARQTELLAQRIPEFPPNHGVPMFMLGQQLTMWIRSAESSWMRSPDAPACGWGGGGGSSSNELRFNLPELRGKTTEELANLIVQLGPKGMWVLDAQPTTLPGCSTDEVRIESYQHYANRPLIEVRTAGSPQQR